MATPLTARTVETIQPTEARQEIPDGKQRGLYLVVQAQRFDAATHKSWCVRYRWDGKSRKMTLGTYPELSLKDARNLAREVIRKVQLAAELEHDDPNRIDPAVAKKERREATKRNHYEDVVKLYIEKWAEPRTRRWRETERILQRIPWHGKGIATIAQSDVEGLLDKITDTPSMANRVHSVLRHFMGWCRDKNLISRSPLERVKAPGFVLSRERVLSDAELVKVWKAADTIGYPFGDVVKLLILTGQRRMEVANMSWNEVDLAASGPREGGGTWTIPRERVKNKRSHQVELSDAVIAILRKLPRVDGSEWVFSLNGIKPANNFGSGKRRLDDLSEVKGWTLHDLRRTMSTGLARLGVNQSVTEKILNHRSGSISGVAAVYNRYDFAAEKREAMQRWSQFVLNLVGAAQAGGLSRPIESP